MKISMGITISAGKATAPGADPQQHFWKFRLPFPTNGIAPITQHPPGKAEHPCRAGLPWPGEASSPTSGFRSFPRAPGEGHQATVPHGMERISVKHFFISVAQGRSSAFADHTISGNDSTHQRLQLSHSCPGSSPHLPKCHHLSHPLPCSYIPGKKKKRKKIPSASQQGLMLSAMTSGSQFVRRVPLPIHKLPLSSLLL